MTRITRLFILMLALGPLAMTASGCALTAGAAAGGVAAGELDENDGEFDPLENTEAAEAVEDAVE